MKPEPMNEGHLEDIKRQIIQVYLYVTSHSGYDPEVVEIMQQVTLAALADVQKRFEAGQVL